MDGTYVSDMKCLVKNAMHLAEQADHLCEQLNRIDDFDEEQRAEMYAILQAIGRDAGIEAATLKSIMGGELEADDV